MRRVSTQALAGPGLRVLSALSWQTSVSSSMVSGPWWSVQERPLGADPPLPMAVSWRPKAGTRLGSVSVPTRATSRQSLRAPWLSFPRMFHSSCRSLLLSGYHSRKVARLPEHYEAANPVNLGLLGTQAEVLDTAPVADLIEQSVATGRFRGHVSSFGYRGVCPDQPSKNNRLRRRPRNYSSKSTGGNPTISPLEYS